MGFHGSLGECTFAQAVANLKRVPCRLLFFKSRAMWGSTIAGGTEKPKSLNRVLCFRSFGFGLCFGKVLGFGV